MTVEWGPFLWTTALGILPMTILMVWAGERIETIPFWAWALLVLAAFLMLAVVHTAKRVKRGSAEN